MDGRGIKDLHKCGEEMSKNSSLSRAENSKKQVSWMARAGGERSKGIRGPRPFVPVGDTNRDKRRAFCPSWSHLPGQKAHVPPLARLAVGPGTKATYCPGPKCSRDKWPGTKAYYIVVVLWLAALPTSIQITIVMKIFLWGFITRLQFRTHHAFTWIGISPTSTNIHQITTTA